MPDPVTPSPVSVPVCVPPPFFWQSVPCPTCGATVGKYCKYPSGRDAHTRHTERDRAVMEEAAFDVIRGAITRMQAGFVAELHGDDRPMILVREPDGSTRPATRDDHLDVLGVPPELRDQL